MTPIKLNWFASTAMHWIQCSLAALLLFSACKQQDKKQPTAAAIEKSLLDRYSLEGDTTGIGTLRTVLGQLNCLSEKELGKKLVLTANFQPSDSGQILVIPCRSILGDMSSSAYSSIKNKVILFNPVLARNFNQQTALNDTTAAEATIALILLHELGHFKLGKEGAFDEPEKSSELGEQYMNTEPEYLSANKRIELAADSIGAAWVAKNVTNTKNMDCYSLAFSVQLALPGMQFNVFGKRVLENFGSTTPKLLRDPSNTHPNLELRIAFMNYYLTKSEEQRRMIEEYLYEREVAPVHRQQSDPRIFQGMEKKLPGDNAQN